MRLRNLDRNFNILENYGDYEVYFSYETPIAFRNIHTSELVVCENVWSDTTKKHLNKISEEKDRVPWEEFKKAMQEIEL